MLKHVNFSMLPCTGERVPLVKIIALAWAAIGLKITSELKHQNPITISSLFSPLTKI